MADAQMPSYTKIDSLAWALEIRSVERYHSGVRLNIKTPGFANIEATEEFVSMYRPQGGDYYVTIKGLPNPVCMTSKAFHENFTLSILWPHITLDEVEDAVNDITVDIFHQTDNGEDPLPLIVSSDGSTILVTFMGVQVWNSEDDCRKYVDEDEEVYEPIEEFLRRAIDQVTMRLFKLNLVA